MTKVMLLKTISKDVSIQAELEVKFLSINPYYCRVYFLIIGRNKEGQLK